MKLSDFGKYKKDFGLKSALSYFYNIIMFKLSKNAKFMQRIYAQVNKYLDLHYGNMLSDGANDRFPDADYKVWVFWWQGEENAPTLVRKCIQTIKANFKNNEVVVLSKDNFSQYVDIPQYILQKVENKIITLTHFSDIMRAALLSEHGGLWLDATIYMTGSIDSELLKHKFYTNHLPQDKKYDMYVSKAKWSGFFIGGGKGNNVFVNLKNILFEYWKTHNFLIDYFVVDYIIYLEYSKCANIKKLIDDVPINNTNIHSLAPNLFAKYSDELYRKVTQDTNVFKLSYKFSPKKFRLENTIYKKITEQ